MTGRFAQFAIAFSIFISSYVFFKTPFEAYPSYIVMLLFFPAYLARLPFPREVILVFAPPLAAGILSIQAGDNEWGLFIKIFLGFFSSVLFYRYVFEAFDRDLEKLFNIYLVGASLVSAIGLFQVASYLVGFESGYNFRWLFNKWSLSYGGTGVRMNSVFSEPAYFAGVIGPAFFVAINNLITRDAKFISRKASWIIAIAYPLTFSTLGFMSMAITALLLLVNYGFIRYALLVGPLVFFGYDYAYENIPEFRQRIDGTQTAFGEGDPKDLNDVHGSSFVLYNNYVITVENFKRHPIFGTGLGSHPVAFDKYSLTNMAGILKIDFNKADANSMFLRLLSETGLYGVTVMLVLILRNFFTRQRSANDTNWLISHSVLVVILVYLARQGHYFINGFPFFLWMYYFIRKQNSAQMQQLREEAEAMKQEQQGHVVVAS